MDDPPRSVYFNGEWVKMTDGCFGSQFDRIRSAPRIHHGGRAIIIPIAPAARRDRGNFLMTTGRSSDRDEAARVRRIGAGFTSRAQAAAARTGRHRRCAHLPMVSNHAYL